MRTTDLDGYGTDIIGGQPVPEGTDAPAPSSAAHVNATYLLGANRELGECVIARNCSWGRFVKLAIRSISYLTEEVSSPAKSPTVVVDAAGVERPGGHLGEASWRW